MLAHGVRRHPLDGITANALMPGGILTKLQRHLDTRTLTDFGVIGEDGVRRSPEGWKTPEQGAVTSVLLATSPLLEGIGGRYFEDCAEAVPITGEDSGWHGVAPYALDRASADRLWEETLRMLA